MSQRIAAKRKALVRQAGHHPLDGSPDNPYPGNLVPPGMTPAGVRRVATTICSRIYHGKCACERRDDMPVCSTMWGAACAAIEAVEAGPA